MAWALPFLILAWIFVFPRLRGPLWDVGFYVLSLGVFLVIGYAGRSNLWALLVWLVPWAGLTVAAIAGARGPIFSVLALCVLAYTSLLMLYAWPYAWVGRATRWLWGALVAAGLPAREREAFRLLFRGRRLTREESRDAKNWDDRQRMADALRAPGDRILAISPPDAEWASVLEAIAAPMMEWSRAINQGETPEYTALNSAVERASGEFDRLLRARSVPYRILEWVPRGAR